MTPFDSMPHYVTVYEVGPRDGLQNSPHAISTETKVRFIDLLSAAGLPVIEVTSFVRPGAIPNLADAEDVVARIDRGSGAAFTALVPNARGMERARNAGLRGIAVFTAASETFSRRNTNATIAETLERFVPVLAEALAGGLTTRAYVSTAFGCPYEGDVAPGAVVAVARELCELGAQEIVISDTIGVADPLQVHRVVREVRAAVPDANIALHFHDTRGTALANVLAGLLEGVTVFDASAGGLGGCPYAPGAAGNLATEDLVYMLDRMGIETGVQLDGVVAASRMLAEATGDQPASRYYAAAAG